MHGPHYNFMDFFSLTSKVASWVINLYRQIVRLINAHNHAEVHIETSISSHHALLSTKTTNLIAINRLPEMFRGLDRLRAQARYSRWVGGDYFEGDNK